MNEKISLTELQLIIRDALYTTVPGIFWVNAEISEIKENSSGHCYLELIDKKADSEDIKAKARAIIWANRYRMLKPFFENTTGESLRSGIKVLLKVSLEYHEIYGLSLIVSDIDAAYTIGEMAVRRQQIIRRLSEEGVLDMNKEIPFPMLSKHIAIISSKNAAGYIDFIKQLDSNPNGYIFHKALFEATMQGTETSESIINALNKISLLADVFDVVVIIRGGGSQTDLSWFDNYELAYHITQFPLPVLTGIGHDKDLSITDIVANISVKTPTAAADFLINHMSDTEDYISELGTLIKSRSEDIIGKYRDQLSGFSKNLIPVARISVAERNEKLSNTKFRLYSHGKNLVSYSMLLNQSRCSRLESLSKGFIKDNFTNVLKYRNELSDTTNALLKHSGNKIKEVEVVLNLINPLNILKRGFTITYFDGKIVKSSTILSSGDMIETQFSDGIAKSVIAGKEENHNK